LRRKELVSLAVFLDVQYQCQNHSDWFSFCFVCDQCGIRIQTAWKTGFLDSMLWRLNPAKPG